MPPCSTKDKAKDKACPCVHVAILTESFSSLTPMKDLDRSASPLDFGHDKTGPKGITTVHVQSLLATLSPPTGSCSSDSDDLDDDLSIGSIEDFGTTIGAALDVSWACHPADIEIFP